MKFEVKRIDVSKAFKGIENLKDAKLMVGWFEDTKYTDGTHVADVAEWQEYGGEEFDVMYPPRPFMRPAEEKNLQKWINIVEKQLEQGKTTKQAFNVLGDVVKGDIQKEIIAVMSPALAERTLKARRKRGNKSEKPLVDTGVMLHSVGKKVEDV